MSDNKSDRLSGPTRSRAAIKELEEFLKKNCEEAQLVSHILQTFQYETGHEPRKTMQYMEAIQSVGKIRLFKNDGELYVEWGRDKKSEPEEKGQGVEPEMNMNSETPFTDYAKRETLLKDLNEARNELGLPPLPIRKDS